MPPLPTPIQAFAMATLNGNVYVFGGSQSTKLCTNSTSAVYMYLGTLGQTWIQRSAIPIALESHTAVAIDNYSALICGGRTSGVCTARSACYIYTAVNDSWQS